MLSLRSALRSWLDRFGARFPRAPFDDVRAAIDRIEEIVVVVAQQKNAVYLNAQWYRITGAGGAGHGRGWRTFIDPDDLPALDERLAHTADAGDSAAPLELRVRTANGTFRWFAVRLTTLPHQPGAGIRQLLALTDIDELKRARALLAASMLELDSVAADATPEIPDRTRLVEHLKNALGLAERAGTGVVVLYLDLDHFTSINDDYGRAGGDAILAQIGERINGVLRAGDTAMRFGGDEFVLVCATSAGARHAVYIAERLAQSLAEPIVIGNRCVDVAASIGISLYPSDGTDAQELIDKAKTAMGEAKASGRSTYRIFGERLHEATVGAIEFEADLRHAIAVNEFTVHYQPIVNITSGVVLGAEALVRWQHPRRGLLLPGEFIPFAERQNLIGLIGDIVLQTACAELNRFVLESDDPFAISINVSAAQFFTPGFVETIARAIARYNIGAQRLELEITESIMMGNGPGIIDTVKRLKALGVRLSIDDFGTGYSSLAYLRDFPIDTLKIDRSFVTGITTNRTQEAISGAIVTLAHSMGIHVVGEGVETQEQIDALRAMRSDSLQGNFISRPLPAAQFESFVATYDAGVFPALRRRRLAYWDSDGEAVPSSGKS